MGCRAFDFVTCIKQAEIAAEIPLEELEPSILERSLKRVARHIRDQSFGPSLSKALSPLFTHLSKKKGQKELPVAKVIHRFLQSPDHSERQIGENVHLLYLKQDIQKKGIKVALKEALDHPPTPFFLKALLLVEETPYPLSSSDLIPLFVKLIEKTSNDRELHLTLDSLALMQKKNLSFSEQELASLLLHCARARGNLVLFNKLLLSSPLFTQEVFEEIFSKLLMLYFSKLDSRSYHFLLDFVKNSSCLKESSSKLNLPSKLYAALEEQPELKKELKEANIFLSKLL